MAVIGPVILATFGHFFALSVKDELLSKNPRFDTIIEETDEELR